MKLLLFSDLHADAAAAERLAAMAAEADLLIGAGDLGNLRRQVEVCLKVLGRTHKPALLTPGNNESDEELRAAAARWWPESQVLHGAGTEVGGRTFFGLGGGVPTTPFGDWSFDLSEAEAEQRLAAMPIGAVLVSHSPPRGCVDRDSRGRSLGSESVRAAIMRAGAPLAVCGHIHGSGGQTGWLGECRVVNAGPTGVWATLSG
ncbi:MAG: metallophosphoesterase family protein [Pirellulales bacterium]